MQPSWVLEDGTRIDLTAVANRDALSLFAPQAWSARINGAPVPTRTRQIRGASSENLFQLSDGREVVASVLMLRGARVFELAVDDQRILYPGKRPFTCPVCSNPVEPHLPVCILCKAEQPGCEERIREMQCKALATSLLQLNLVCVVLGISQILSSHSGSAFAWLRGAEAATTVPVVQVLQGANDLQQTLAGLATYMLCVFGCAFLALRSPAAGAVLNLLTLAFMLANHLLSFDGWLVLALGAVLMLWSILTAERGIEIAHARKQPAARPRS